MNDLIGKFESNSLDDVLIVDAHMHLGKPPGFFSAGNDAAGLIKSMDLNGVSLGCISSFDSIGQDPVKGNCDIEKLAEDYPRRFVGQFGINPNYNSQTDEILETAVNKRAFKQIKLHPDFHNYPIDGRAYQKVYEFAGENGYSILVHTWGTDDVGKLGQMAALYPMTDFVMGHSGGTLKAIKKAVGLAGESNNIYLDLTISYNYQGIIEWMVKEAGASRLLFGSDATHNSQSAALGKIIYADIDDEAKLRILGKNMMDLLDKRG